MSKYCQCWCHIQAHVIAEDEPCCAQMGTVKALLNPLPFGRGTSLIESNPDIAGGKPIFVGTRITFMQIKDLLDQGAMPGELEEDYPGITPAQWNFIYHVVDLNAS